MYRPPLVRPENLMRAVGIVITCLRRSEVNKMSSIGSQ